MLWSQLLLLLTVFDYTMATGNDTKPTETSGVRITLTPNNVYSTIAEGHTAVYNCTASHSSVVIAWFFNGTEPALASMFILMGVTATGAGSPVSSLFVPGVAYPFNRTNVSCFASGPVAGIVNPPPVFLRIQGLLSAVGDLEISTTNFSLSWTPPFTLPGVPITRYNINVTKGDDTVINTSKTSDTKWSYCPSQFGNYSISIAAVNTVGEGEIITSTKYYNAREYVIDDVIHINQYHEMDDWIIILNITVSASDTSWSACINIVSLISTDSSLTANTTNFSISSSSDQLMATFNTFSSIPDDQYYNFTAHIVHTNGLEVNYTKPLMLSFFDVKNFSFTLVEGALKLRCEFVQGSQAIGCHISLNSSTLMREINITREKETDLITLPPGYWSIDVFDINRDNTIASSPAFTSTVHVSMASSISSTTHSYTLSSSSELVSTLPAASSTVIATIPPPVAANINSGTIGGIASSIIVIAAMVIVVIAIIVGFVYRRKKITKANMQNTNKVIVMGSTGYEPNTCLYDEVGPRVELKMANPLYSITPDDAPDSGTSDTAVNGITSTYSMIESANIEEPVTIDSTYSEVGPVAAVDSSDEKYTENKKLTQEILSEHVAPYLTSKWRLLGLALAITPPQLDDIEERIQEEDEEGKGQEEINEVFRVWEEQETRAFDWDTLLTTLRSETVGESELSDELAKLQV